MRVPLPAAPFPSPSAPEGVERFRRMVWWSTVGLVYLLGAVVLGAIFLAEPLGLPAAVAAAGAVAGTWGAAWLLDRRVSRATPVERSHLDRAHRNMVILGGAGALAVVMAAPAAQRAPSGALIPGVVVGAAAVWVPRRWKPWVVAGSVAVMAGLTTSLRYLISRETAWEDLFNAAFMGLIALAIISTVWSWDVLVRLDRTRLLEAELAVADERLRFAADLHDVQGHHLHVIALESELATRLAGSDPEAARAHMEQVNEHARSALNETRDLVQGYRRTSLREELANATRVLAAAGIDGRLGQATEQAAERLPESSRQVLGLVVREATTNILRHSRATRARLVLEEEEQWAHLEVSNDGVAPTSQRPGHPPGSGLGNLSERLGAAGGGLEWSQEGEWFQVAARVPASGGSA